MQLSEQRHLSLTSHRLHSIAELHLYRSLTLEDWPYVAGGRKLRKFSRTTVSQPELGAITRRLVIVVRKVHTI